MSSGRSRNYKDEYREGLQRIIDAKIAGEEIVAPAVETPPRVVNLMEALKKMRGQHHEEETGEGRGCPTGREPQTGVRRRTTRADGDAGPVSPQSFDGLRLQAYSKKAGIRPATSTTPPLAQPRARSA
jgi:hypothetical protein